MKKSLITKIFFTLTSFIVNTCYPKIVEYNLDIKPITTNITGKKVSALSINGTIPGPTIKATIGDTLKINVHNSLDKGTSIHWHGVLLPNRMDGVPFVTTPIILPNKSFTYTFKVKHTGTYWYHSHSGLQEQQGVFGAMVFYPREKTEHYNKELVVVISDWMNKEGLKVLANLKKMPEYYALRKGTVQSWLEVFSYGKKAINLRLQRAITRMLPRDMSDIGYDAFLINGKQINHLSDAKPGMRIKLRIVNASASSYSIIQYSGGPMTVVEADGVEVEPFTVDKLRIAVAETYNVIIKIPEQKTYELRATSEDVTGYASGFIGSGDLVPAPNIKEPILVLEPSKMDNMSKGSKAMQQRRKNKGIKKQMPKYMNMSISQKKIQNKDGHVPYLTNYTPLKAIRPTTLPKNAPRRTIKLRLTGSMLQYNWSINNIPLYASEKVLIKKGEVVRLILKNETMMHHPMHLHGHFFRVLNGQGNRSPLKHTVNVPRFETVEIEFYANEDKDWFFHCHNLYHLVSGMARIIHYEGSTLDPDILDHAKNLANDRGKMWFVFNELDIFSNIAQIKTSFISRQNYLTFSFRYKESKKDYEIEAFYERLFSPFLGILFGASLEKEFGVQENLGVIGVRYMLPFFLNSTIWFQSNKKVRFQLDSIIQLTNRLSLDWLINSDQEYQAILRFNVNQNLYFAMNYDNRNKANYEHSERFGVGLSWLF